MPTFTELLPPCKTSPHRAIRYTPACSGVGVLELDDVKSSTRYAVARQPYGGVRFTKADGETYVAVAGQCECKGFVFGRGKPCRHLEALVAITANGWLDFDDREVIRDIHAEAEEQDAWWERGEDRLADDEYADAIGRRIVREPLPA